MMTRIPLVPVMFLLCFLAAGSDGAQAEPYWVFFTDRGSVDVSRSVAAKAISVAEPKSVSRRAKILGNAIFDERDLPVNPAYVAAVAEITGPVRTTTRYFNGVSVNVDSAGLDAIRKLPFVQSVQPVVRFHKSEPDTLSSGPAVARKQASLSYGSSYFQMNTVGVIKLHDQGYYGDGITIAVLDAGFENLGHAAFDSIQIAGQRDFVDGDDNMSGSDHGAKVFSVMAANAPGTMIGAAPHATYFLARTEIDSGEDTHAEEDYFVSGVEWADSLGVDIIHTSLGYTTFADGPSYTYADLDGETAVTTVAAEIAAEKGIVVVCSAGNEGDKTWHFISTPADGEKVIAVGSVEPDGSVSDFSSRGPAADGRVKPDFMALGSGVRVIDMAGDAYTTGRGTSFAAPAVSGAAALLLQVHPEWTASALYDSLKATATSVAADSLAGYGLINAFAASGLTDTTGAVSAFRVYNPFPQPGTFKSSTSRICFPVDIPEGGKTVILTIYAFSGEVVNRLEKTVATAGSYRDPTAKDWDGTNAPNWDGTNFTGDTVASGIYFYTVTCAGYPGHKGKIAVIR